MAEQIGDGLKKEVLKAGSGDRPNRGDTITVQCTGSLNGTPPKKFWRYIAQRSCAREVSPHIIIWVACPCAVVEVSYDSLSPSLIPGLLGTRLSLPYTAVSWGCDHSDT